MRMILVESKNLKAVGYDPARREMDVSFKNGSTFHHHDVPPEVHSALMSADSHGQHYAQYVKGRFTGRQGDRAPMLEPRDTGSAPINDPHQSLEAALDRFQRRTIP